MDMFRGIEEVLIKMVKIKKSKKKNFLKSEKKFSWTNTMEFWAEILSQCRQQKVEEHNGPSEF